MDKAKAVRPSEALNWKDLEIYLRSAIPDLSGEMEVAQFHGGHANLTYLLQFGKRELVLRRPPFGKIAPGAHDMKREYRVLSKLYKVFPRAPRAFHLCEDENIVGAKFVVMERKNGIIVRYQVPEVFKSFDNIEERLTIALIKASADLHKVDVTAADLSELGKPEGFIERQLAGWEKRWALSKTEENPAMTTIFEKLNADIPKPQTVSIVHNDIKFDNCQFQVDNPDEITALFDWDMTTIGDPLADFGMTLSYWKDDRLSAIKDLPVMLKGDFPSKDFLKEKYQAYTGLNLDRIDWYEALSYIKMAVIGQQLYKRFVEGATKDKRMASFGKSSQVMIQMAKEIVERF